MSQQFRRGEIVLIRFPFTDLSGSKRRPAVILAEYQSDIIVAFISSVIPKIPEPSDILLTPSHSYFTKTGLKKASIIRLRKLATLEQALITRRLGNLDTQVIQLLDIKLISSLGIDTNQIIKAEYQRLAEMIREKGAAYVISLISTTIDN